MRYVLVLAGLIFAWAGPPTVLADSHAEQARPAAGEPMILPVDSSPLVIGTSKGDRAFSVEVAATGRERSAGLMYRQDMEDRHGMLFVFADTRPVGFWMKDTPMALDLVFIGEDGVIRDILPGEPHSTDTISPGVPVRFVLELKAGTSEKNGISAGDRVRHPLVNEVAEDG